MGRKLTTKEFIAKAKEVHGYKYDYKFVKYVNGRTKVSIGCDVHGLFSQPPRDHIYSKAGCPDCGDSIGAVKRIKLTTRGFIEQANKVHNNKYDYSETVYVNTKEKITIICPIHAKFKQLGNHHLLGVGCLVCSGSKKGTTQEFINKAKSVHGDRYDYSKVEYVNRKEKVEIICKKHGSFFQTIVLHLKNSGCQKCEMCPESKVKEFIAEARKVHGNKFDYSKAHYKDSKSKITIICPKHGYLRQTIWNHIHGNGCAKCTRDSLKSNTEEFILRSKDIHGDRFDYSKVKYIGNKEKVIIICKIHNEFRQRPNDHLNNLGCRLCRHKENITYGIIYGIYDFADNLVYVGQTVKTLKRRLQAHINTSGYITGTMPICKWLSEIAYTPEIKPILENVPIQDLDKEEKRLIKQLGKRFKLFNVMHNV